MMIMTIIMILMMIPDPYCSQYCGMTADDDDIDNSNDILIMMNMMTLIFTNFVKGCRHKWSI